MHLTMVVGPALGGVLYGFGSARLAYCAEALLMAFGLLALTGATVTLVEGCSGFCSSWLLGVLAGARSGVLDRRDLDVLVRRRVALVRHVNEFDTGLALEQGR